MDLITRGRLSIQRVDPKAYETITLLAQTGGWDSLDFISAGKRTPKTKTTSYKEVSSNDEFDEPVPAASKKSGGRGRPRGGRALASKRKRYAEEDEFDDELDSESDFNAGDDDDYGSSSKKGGKKRKIAKKAGDDDGDYRASRPGKRRSTRA